MNQILGNIKIENLSINNQNKEIYKKDKKIFKYLFIFSIIIMIIFFSFFIHKTYYTKQNEKISNYLQYNYNTIKLYNNNSVFNYENLSQNNQYSENVLIGEIEIPILNISYPIFSILTDENLKITPCIFSGKMPPEISNLCIAGHNYNNSQFFSLINKLKEGDTIHIYDNKNHKYTYSVFANYEVKTDDLSPTLYNNKFHELTLVTCNNYNNNRIIIKAKY